MSNNFTEISVSARFSSLSELMQHIAEQAAEAGADNHAIQRIQLVLEELFTNTVNHGYGGESDAPIGARLACHQGEITLDYTDRAPCFDLGKMPLQDASTVDVGGLGLTLIHSLSKQVSHHYAAHANHVRVTF